MPSEPGVHGERLSAVALAGLIALVVLTPWPYGAAHPVAAQAVSLITLATAVGILVGRARITEPTIHPMPVWPFVGLFALAAFQLLPLPRALLALVAPGASAIWYPSVHAAAAVLGDGPRPVSLYPEGTRRVLAFTTGLVMLALLAVPALRARRLALRATIAVVAGALAVAVYGVVARTLFGVLLYGSIPVPTIAPFGPFVSKNHFAGCVEMAALLAMGLALGLADEARRSAAALSWVGSPKAGRVVMAFGAATAMALAVLISLSRGGAVSLAVGGVALVLLRRFVRRRRSAPRRGLATAAVFLAVASVAVATLPSPARSRLATIAGIGTDHSGQFRLGVWGDTLRLWARSPVVGHGFGAYRHALPPVKTGLGYVTLEHAESDGMEALAEGGLAGLLLTLIAIGLFARQVVRGLPQQTDRLRRGLGLGATAGVWALLVHSTFDFNLRIPSNALLFCFLGALALAASSPSEPAGGTSPDESPRPTGSRLVRFGTLAVAAMALAAAAWIPAQRERALPDEALPFAAHGGRPVTPLRVKQATAAIIDHLRGRPANAEAWLFLAWLRSAAGAQEEAAELARYAASLDPQRAALQAEARRIGEGR